MLLHWAKTARAGSVALEVPSSLAGAARRELLRNFTLACLTARQARGPLLGYAPASVPALRPYAANFLTAGTAQVAPSSVLGLMGRYLVTLSSLALSCQHALSRVLLLLQSVRFGGLWIMTSGGSLPCAMPAACVPDGMITALSHNPPGISKGSNAMHFVRWLGVLELPMSTAPVQALVVGAAHMLQLPETAAVPVIVAAVSDRVCSLLVEATSAQREVCN